MSHPTRSEQINRIGTPDRAALMPLVSTVLLVLRPMYVILVPVSARW